MGSFAETLILVANPKAIKRTAFIESPWKWSGGRTQAPTRFAFHPPKPPYPRHGGPSRIGPRIVG